MDDTTKNEGQPNSPRVPWIAGALSLFMPGLGQLYCGQVKKGFYIFLSFYLTATGLMFLFLIPVPLFPEISFLSLVFVIYIYVVKDAITIARNNKEFYRLKKYNKWYLYIIIYVASVFLAEPISASIRNYAIQAFKIPSGSMKNTLLVGDHILVSKSSYGLKGYEGSMVESFNLVSRTPERGDIVVFKFPKDEQRDFIKRVIGLPGEKIEIINQKVFINDQLLANELYISLQKPLKKHVFSSIDDFGPFIIPQGHLFVLGDNRDNSLDSRSFGPIDINKVKGKVIRIYWSWDSDENRVRFERIGKLIQ